MAKPTIVTRAGKGSALTWTEGDTNLTNLRDATVSIKAGSAGTSVTSDLNGEIVLVAGTNITLSGNNTSKEITINSSQASVTDATNAANIGIASTDGNASDTTMSVVLVGAQTATNQAPHIDSGLTYNASTNALTATTFSGALSGNATTATTLATARAIYGNNFDGSAALTQIIASTYGGTGNGFTKFTGPTTAERTFTLPDASSTIVVQGGALGTPSSGTVTNLTGTASININGTVGATTANTGAFTTISASTTTTSGALNVTYTPSAASGAAIQTTGKDSQGGVGYFDFLKVTNTTSGATNANKTLRTGSTGTLELLNNAYSSVILSVTDAGVLTTTSIQNTPIGSSTASTGAFTTLSASSTVSGTGFSTYLASPPAIGGTTAAAVSATTLTFKDPREAIYDLGTTGGTIAPNVANGSVQKITLNSALTINAFTSPVAGQSLTLIIFGGTAYTSITSTMKFAGGVKTLTGTASCIDILSVYYDGTNYYASLAKGFA